MANPEAGTINTRKNSALERRGRRRGAEKMYTVGHQESELKRSLEALAAISFCG